MVEEEPPFLNGQTKLSVDMSPVKIVKVLQTAFRIILVHFVFHLLAVPRNLIRRFHFDRIQMVLCRGQL
jgi:hypothetical protein